jgi:hypothetical protein
MALVERSAAAHGLQTRNRAGCVCAARRGAPVLQIHRIQVATFGCDGATRASIDYRTMGTQAMTGSLDDWGTSGSAIAELQLGPQGQRGRAQ